MVQGQSQIPFIDIAVQNAVRSAMLDGKAAVLFDQTIETIIWANGSAAKIFGYSSIGDFLDAGLTPFAITARQIKSVASRKSEKPVSMALRITAGMNSQLVQTRIQSISIASYQGHFILLVLEPAHADVELSGTGIETIEALEADGGGAAICDGTGDIITAGALFASFEIPHDELVNLAAEVATENDRLVKRLVSRGPSKTKIAVGIGRLSEIPPRNLIVAMETDIEDATLIKEEETAPSPPETNQVHHITPPPLFSEGKREDGYDDDDDQDAQSQQAPTIMGAPKKTLGSNERPVRFVWKTDYAGDFIEVSSEFSKAVGDKAANIVGRSMADVVKAFSLDPTGSILAAMQRRDTWSGKSVLWPVEGTELSVPIDLAALPYYDREKNFEGYRGFGIVRLADAIVDPETIGLSLDHAFENDDHAPEGTHLTEDAPHIYDEPASGDLFTNEQTQTDSAQPIDDPFKGETPALETPPLTPMRRGSDYEKIVHFDEIRQNKMRKEALDDDEAAAFKKIGEALGKNDTADTDTDAENEVNLEDNSDDIFEPQEAPPVLSMSEFAPLSVQTDESDAKTDKNEKNEPAQESQESDDALPPSAFEDNFTAPVFEPEAGLGPDALNALPLPLLIVRGEEVLFGNHAFFKMSGYQTIDMLNQTGLSNLFGDDDQTALEHNDLVETDRPLTLIDSGGKAISARAHLQLVPWMGITALMFAFDPMDKAQAETAQENSTIINDVSEELSSAAFDEIAEMRAILDTATDGVVVIGQDGAIRSINGSASALFGYTDEEVFGKSFSILFATESQRLAMDYLGGFSNNSVASLLNEGREVLARERNGGFLPVFMTIGKLPTSNGYCAVMRDITPWKQTEQALETAKQAAEDASSTKSEFLAKISHEIRTPLNAIIGFSELMVEERFGPVGNPRYKDYLSDINKSGRHVLDLVNDLLDISKIEAGQQDLNFEEVLLNEAVFDAVSMIQPQANRNRIIVRSSLENSLPSVVADMRSIKQIVLNLLSNAVRFTHSGGQVVISTNYTARGSVVLRIRDTGIGMTPREIETALKPFEQVSSRQQDMSDGTGLGLPLTKALVEANRAEFDINSEPGRGTSVEITFPPARVLAD